MRPFAKSKQASEICEHLDVGDGDGNSGDDENDDDNEINGDDHLDDHDDDAGGTFGMG